MLLGDDGEDGGLGAGGGHRDTLREEGPVGEDPVGQRRRLLVAGQEEDLACAGVDDAALEPGGVGVEDDDGAGGGERGDEPGQPRAGDDTGGRGGERADAHLLGAVGQDGGGLGGVDVDLPQAALPRSLAAADDGDRLARGVEAGAQGGGLRRRRVEDVHDLEVPLPAVLGTDDARAEGARRLVSRRPGRGQARQRLPGAGRGGGAAVDHGRERLEEDGVARRAGVDDTALGEDRELAAGVAERAGGALRGGGDDAGQAPVGGLLRGPGGGRGDGEDGALDGAGHRLAGVVGGGGERRGGGRAVERVPAVDRTGQAAHRLAEDDPGVAPGPDERAPGRGGGERGEVRLRAEAAGGAGSPGEGEDEVGAGVPVRDGEDVEDVDLPADGEERPQPLLEPAAHVRGPEHGERVRHVRPPGYRRSRSG